MATGLSTAITKDGQTTTTARIPFAAGINSSLTTDSTSTGTGSIFTAGGVGIAKTAYIGTNLSFSGTGNRITGDFSNATHSSRALFQTSTANSNTAIGAIPVGTGNTAQFIAYGNGDPTNSSFIQLLVNASEGRINSGQLGAGSNLPMTFYTGGSERVRVDTSGNLLVGGTTTGGRVTSISSTNDLFYGYNGAQKFAVTNGGTIFAVNTTISAISDIRYKENVRDLDVGLDKIMALKPRLYDWKEGKGADIKNARGFIAQEFEQVFPDLIDKWKDPAPEGEEPYKSVRQDLIPVLVKAIQEQQALITSLTTRITALESN